MTEWGGLFQCAEGKGPSKNTSVFARGTSWRFATGRSHAQHVGLNKYEYDFAVYVRI